MLLSIKLAFPRALTPCFPYQTVIGVKYSGEILSTSQTPADFYQNYLQLKCLTNDSSLMTSKVCFVKSIYACMPLFNFSIKLSQCPQVQTWTPYIWETQNIFLKLILLTRSPYHNTTMTHLWFAGCCARFPTNLLLHVNERQCQWNLFQTRATSWNFLCFSNTPPAFHFFSLFL